MKRSEMLNKLDDFLISEGFHKAGSYDLANTILNLVEKAGMIPPLNETVYHHMDNSDRVAVNDALSYFTWESEDD